MKFLKNLFKKQIRRTIEMKSPNITEWTTIIEDAPTILKNSRGIESIITTLEQGSKTAKLVKIQNRTKKERTKNKLQKRIDAYGR